MKELFKTYTALQFCINLVPILLLVSFFKLFNKFPPTQKQSDVMFYPCHTTECHCCLRVLKLHTPMTTHRMLHLAHLALVFPPHKWSNEPMVPFYSFSLKKTKQKNKTCWNGSNMTTWEAKKKNAIPRWQWPKTWDFREKKELIK